MKQKTLTCRECGESFPVSPDRLPSFCPQCGRELLLDAGQVRELLGEKPPRPGHEPIPDLPTEGAEPKTPGGYVLEALRWALIVAAMIGIMTFLFSQAARLLH